MHTVGFHMHMHIHALSQYTHISERLPTYAHTYTNKQIKWLKEEKIKLPGLMGLIPIGHELV